MCFGPIFCDGIDDDCLLISNAVDIIHDYKKAWIGKNFFLLKFHVNRAFSGNDNVPIKLHFFFTFETDVVYNFAPNLQHNKKKYGQETYQVLRNLFNHQASDFARAVPEAEGILPYELTDQRWTFGDFKQLFPIIGVDNQESLIEKMQQLILKKVSENLSEEQFRFEIKNISTKYKHIVVSLTGDFPQDSCFLIGFTCDNSKAIKYRNNNGIIANLFFYNKEALDELIDLVEDKGIEEQINFFRTNGKIVPLAFMQVMLFTPRLIKEITPDFKRNWPPVSIMRKPESPKGKEWEDGRSFVIFRADDEKLPHNHFVTRWVLESKFDPSQPWVQWVIALSAFVAAVFAMLAYFY